eukprot:scaffold7607_cov84-Amphora_coffeaeformis.AAC.1
MWRCMALDWRSSEIPTSNEKFRPEQRLFFSLCVGPIVRTIPFAVEGRMAMRISFMLSEG